MNRPAPHRVALLYWLTAAACLVVTVTDIMQGNPAKIVGSVALLASFVLLALFPRADQRPRWVGWTSMVLVLVALGSLAYRLTRPAG
ncbi:hypothetical protein [Hymenobacter sp. B81]|uniref:hypothetical protein n=1 Tax=Hymenobacter sp. B81 TaxID=3344878 RepID=UPI0037DDB54E